MVNFRKISPSVPLQNILAATVNIVVKFYRRCIDGFRILNRNEYSFVDSFNIYGIPAIKSYTRKQSLHPWSWFSIFCVTVPTLFTGIAILVNNAKYDNDDVRFWAHDWAK